MKLIFKIYKIIILVFYIFTSQYVYALDDAPPTIMTQDEYIKILPHGESITFKLINKNIDIIKSLDGNTYQIKSEEIKNKIFDTCMIGEQCHITGTVKGQEIIQVSHVNRNFDINISNIPTNGFGIFGFNLNDSYNNIINKAKNAGFCISHDSLSPPIKPLSSPIETAVDKRAWPSLSLFNAFPPLNSKFSNDNFKLQNLIKNHPDIFPYIEIWGNAQGKYPGTIKLNFYFLKLLEFSEPKMFSFIVETNLNEQFLVHTLDTTYKLIYDFPDDYFLRNISGFYVWEDNGEYAILIEKMGLIFYSPNLINIINKLNIDNFGNHKNIEQSNNTTSSILYGKAEYRSEAGMKFIYLIEKNGKEIFLGAPFEIEENQSKVCIGKSLKDDSEIAIQGKLIKDSEGNYSFEEDKYECIK